MLGTGGAWGLRIAAAVAVAFGLLTLMEGGTVLFGSEAARRGAGHYVPFVLWFNFLAGFVYVVAGAGLWAHRRWAVWLALSLRSARQRCSPRSASTCFSAARSKCAPWRPWPSGPPSGR